MLKWVQRWVEKAGKMEKGFDAIKMVLEGIYKGSDPPLIESVTRCHLIREVL